MTPRGFIRVHAITDDKDRKPYDVLINCAHIIFVGEGFPGHTVLVLAHTVPYAKQAVVTTTPYEDIVTAIMVAVERHLP